MPLPAAAIAAIAAAGGSLLNTGIGAYQSGRNTRRTILANKELAEYAYSKDLEMWHRSNEYNSPEMQMARLKAAGLNPNLVYGTGAVANTSGQIPKYQAPRVEYDVMPPQLDVANTIMTYQDVAVKQAQVDNIKAQTRNIEQRTVLDMIRESIYLTDKDRKKLEYGIAKSLEAETIAQGQYKTDIMAQNLDIGREKYKQEQIKTEILGYKKTWEKYGLSGRDRFLIKGAFQLFEKLNWDTSWLVNMLRDIPGGIDLIFKDTGEYFDKRGQQPKKAPIWWHFR